MNHNLVLGIDGGGTKTLAALVDQSGRLAATVRVGGTNPFDNPAWQTELDAALEPLVKSSHLVAGAAALPGYGEVEAISNAQDAAVAGFLGSPRLVLNDVDAAQIGAFAGGPGILVLSGTGSTGWARDADGRSHRVGGWGDVVGDEGSGFWIGRRILGLVSRSLDGRAGASGLADALLAELGNHGATPFERIELWVSSLRHPRSQISALATIVLRLAEAGDPDSHAIIDDAAEELARHVRTSERQVGRLPWSFAGGMFRSRVFLDAVARHVGRRPVPPRLPPIGGALLAAARLAEWPTDEYWVERLSASLQELPSNRTIVELTTT